MSFTTALARANASVQKHMPNVMASLDGGEPFGVVFRSPHEVVLGGIAATRPSAGMLSSLAAHAVQDSRLRIIDGDEYTVASIEPDGTGWTVLVLELVQ